MIDHFTFFCSFSSSFGESTKYHSWQQKTAFLRSSFCQPFHTSIWHSLKFFSYLLRVIFQGLDTWELNFFFASNSQTLTNEGEHKSKFITNYYSWFWNIYSFLCKPNIIDTSILMFFFLFMSCDHSALGGENDGMECEWWKMTLLKHADVITYMN